jgi:flagellar protein FliL
MKKIIIIVGAVVVLLGGGGAGVYFLMPDLLPEFIHPKDAAKGNAAKSHQEEEKHEHEVGADLDVFVVNLAGSGPSRYLRTTLSLGVKDEHEKEKIKEMSGKIRHAVIMYLTERNADELAEPAGKEKLRKDLHKKIADAVGDKKLVTNVYFKEFLIQ